MSVTRSVVKVAFFCDGTLSTKNAKPNNIIGRLLSPLMYSPHNSIVQLFENCEEEHKFYFEGPGADICSNKTEGFVFSKLLFSIGGAIDGHIGEHGIGKTLAEVKKILLAIAQQARNDGKVHLEVHVYSWSRGGFLAWKIKKLIAQLIAEGAINNISLHLKNIDPVAGGPFDRFYLWLEREKKDPNIPIHSTTFISDSGNLKIWHELRKFFFYRNTIFFSGLLLDDDDPNAKRYIFKGHHEAAVNKSGHEPDPDHPDRLVGSAVLGVIVEESTLAFNPEWKEKVIKEGKRALKEMAKRDLLPEKARAFLNPKQGTFFFGESTINCTHITELAKEETDAADCIKASRNLLAWKQEKDIPNDDLAGSDDIAADANGNSDEADSDPMQMEDNDVKRNFENN